MYYCFQLLRNLTSDDYADYTRSRINDTHTQDVMYYEPDFAEWKDHGTAHASIFTADGAAVAITGTINHRYIVEIAFCLHMTHIIPLHQFKHMKTNTLV